jgi:uncharacterized protein YndB with AHSA1/START domain
MTDADDQLRLEIFIAAPPASVSSFFTEPEKMQRWFGVAHRLEPRPGGVFRVDVHDGNIASGSFTEIVPGRRIVFTWGWEAGGTSGTPPGSSVVEIDLQPEGAGTRLTLTHRGLSGEGRERHGRGWNHYLARLAIAGAGGDPGRDPQIRNLAGGT